MDLFFEEDLCENGPNDYGPCDQSRFPQCTPGRSMICYNRRPMRHRFYKDIRQPVFYIDYRSVFCYPTYVYRFGRSFVRIYSLDCTICSLYIHHAVPHLTSFVRSFLLFPCIHSTWGGCSSCSPGRYCLSERRCILDEHNYPCEKWI